MVVPKNVVEAIDAKIAETEKRVQELRQAAELLPKFESDLHSLRRTRAMFSGEEETSSVSNKVIEVLKNGSIGAAIAEVLSESGHPLHVDDIFKRFQTKGLQTSRATLSSTLVRLMKSGKFKRTGPNTYYL